MTLAENQINSVFRIFKPLVLTVAKVITLLLATPLFDLMTDDLMTHYCGKNVINKNLQVLSLDNCTIQ